MQDVVQLTTNILIWTFGVDEKLTGAVERVGEMQVMVRREPGKNSRSVSLTVDISATFFLNFTFWLPGV
jgi:hypothetical protein